MWELNVHFIVTQNAELIDYTIYIAWFLQIKLEGDVVYFLELRVAHLYFDIELLP